MFTATLEGESELQRAWGSAMNAISQGVSHGVTRGVKEGAAEARSNHRFTSRSGTLERSIEGIAHGWTDGGSRFEGTIRATASHASFVEGGTRPHVIEPRRTRALRFAGAGGQLHFAKIVRHPGTKPMPFMALAYTKAEAVIIREIEVSIARAQEALDR